jgi:LysR family transcriptional activator of nhaA
MSRLNYNHLRYFWAVAHEGNLTRAADHLCVSQSALSIQIQKLETSLGHALFERRGKQLILTEAGQIALDHADEIFAVGNELLTTLTGQGQGERRTVRIGALATLSRNFQMQFLSPLTARDDVEIVLRSGTFGELIRDLRAHLLDVVLSNHAPHRDATTPWIPHLIDEQPVSLIRHKGRRLKKTSLEDCLATEPLIVPSIDSSIRTGFDAMADRMGIRPKIAAEVDDMAMLRLLARENTGLAIVPPIVVEDELQTGLLREVCSIPDLTETFYAITLGRRFPNPLLRTLLP